MKGIISKVEIENRSPRLLEKRGPNDLQRTNPQVAFSQLSLRQQYLDGKREYQREIASSSQKKKVNIPNLNMTNPAHMFIEKMEQSGAFRRNRNRYSKTTQQSPQRESSVESLPAIQGGGDNPAKVVLQEPKDVRI